MGLSPLYDAGGNPLKDDDGNQLYVEVPAPHPRRTVKIPRENRVMKVAKE